MSELIRLKDREFIDKLEALEKEYSMRGKQFPDISITALLGIKQRLENLEDGELPMHIHWWTDAQLELMLIYIEMSGTLRLREAYRFLCKEAEHRKKEEARLTSR